jgi:hypothetical protein
MKKIFFLIVAGLMLATTCINGINRSKSALAVTTLYCDYQQGTESIVSTQTPHFGWQIQSKVNDTEQSAYSIQVFGDMNGKEAKIWDSGKVESAKSQHIPYLGAAPLEQGKKYRWRIRVWNKKNKASKWSEKQSFRVAPSDMDAKWIGAITREKSRLPEGRNFHGGSDKWKETDPLSKRSIYLRKDFPSEKSVRDAVIYICGLGHYELSLNGKKLGNAEFAPLWSEYDKTVYYNTFDVTTLLNRQNTIGVLLGNGFYNEQGGRYVKMQVSFGPPTLFFKMVITYTDGSSKTLSSDETWKYAPSPLTFNDMYGGEDYDARLEQEGWDKPLFNDSDWKPVVVQNAPKGKLTAQTTQPIKIKERFPIKETKKVGDSYVFNMEQNLSGFPEIRISGKKGDKVRFTLGENLGENGLVNQQSIGSPYYFEYTLKGDAEESWRPRFSYYGYRYIQVDGAKPSGADDNRDIPVLLDLQSCFVYNSTPQTGQFQSSNEIFSRTHTLIVNAIKSNMQAVFTDCPHREKLGWLEETHLNGAGLFYNFDQSILMRKVMQDIRDTQLPNGLIPDIAPEYVIFDGGFRDSPEWGIAGVLIPFMYYEFYNDESLIKEYYGVMKRYVDYLSTTADKHILSHGLGDWCDYNIDFPYGPSRNTPIPLSASTHYYMAVARLTEAAKMLGKTEDAARYEALSKEVKKAFNETFFNNETKQYGTGSQASNAMPLFAGLVEEADRKAVLDNLASDIREKGYRLSTGDVGNRYLFRALADNDLNEVMYRMHNHYEVPGYGFQLQFGVTALTELWDPRKGASWNHFMMGQIEEWFFRSLAGIIPVPSNDGIKHIVIAPQAAGDLKWVKANYDTHYGVVSVDWKIDDNQKFSLTVSVPVNCRAKIYLPGKSGFQEVKSGTHTFQTSIE